MTSPEQLREFVSLNPEFRFLGPAPAGTQHRWAQTWESLCALGRRTVDGLARENQPDRPAATQAVADRAVDAVVEAARRSHAHSHGDRAAAKLAATVRHTYTQRHPQQPPSPRQGVQR